MRISDWSSDVCSSDLDSRHRARDRGWAADRLFADPARDVAGRNVCVAAWYRSSVDARHRQAQSSDHHGYGRDAIHVCHSGQHRLAAVGSPPTAWYATLEINNGYSESNQTITKERRVRKGVVSTYRYW